MVAQYLKKGRMAAVDGRLQTRSYENKDGKKYVWQKSWPNLFDF
nr:single-stranded DNA-binding protein [Alicyclobacillus sp. TC]